MSAVYPVPRGLHFCECLGGETSGLLSDFPDFESAVRHLSASSRSALSMKGI